VKGGKYYFTKNQSSLVAFKVGLKYKPGNSFKILAAHTDSPNLRVRPRSKRPNSSGVTQLSVETYGGGLWHTWFDRDLSLAGRVVLRNEDGTFEYVLVDLKRPVCRIPSLCIHLQSTTEREALVVNKEEHLQPILSGEVEKTLTSGLGASSSSWSDNHSPQLISLLNDHLNLEAGGSRTIADFELSLYDAQKASLIGAQGEFISSSRVDNLVSCFTTIEALVDHSKSGLDDEGISGVALFDHEEVGSGSSVGAGSGLMIDAIKRISVSVKGQEEGGDLVSGRCVGGNMRVCCGIHLHDCFSFSSPSPSPQDSHERTIANSFIVSVDMAHAIHPNYPSKHEKGHSPRINDGPVIKTNSNQRYASSGTTSSFITREISRLVGKGKGKGKEIQEFVVRNDCPCGSTIGPILSASTGVLAIDVGCPQLSMHSIRETCGSDDIEKGVDLYVGVFRWFDDVRKKLGNYHGGGGGD